ncbi:hypothetical protein [Paenibacillus sp. 598K]|nr:hypothetical protein [Paenibacillus sp. 598K]
MMGVVLIVLLVMVLISLNGIYLVLKKQVELQQQLLSRLESIDNEQKGGQ